MRKLSLLGLGFILAFCLSQAIAAPDQKNLSLSPTAEPSQVYLPGDIVRIVVGAPVDTANVSAIMPDGQELSLIFDRRTKTWRNFWEVPQGFKKGTYTAKLTAMDVEGKSFEGETAPIFIGEPTMAVMMRLAPTREVKPPPVAVEPAPVTAEAEPVAVEPAPVTAEAEVKPKEEKEKPAEKVAPKKVFAIKPKPREDSVMTRMRLMKAAQRYLAERDYDRAKRELMALLKIDPGNKEIKLMLGRIEAVLRAKERIE